MLRSNNQTALNVRSNKTGFALGLAGSPCFNIWRHWSTNMDMPLQESTNFDQFVKPAPLAGLAAVWGFRGTLQPPGGRADLRRLASGRNVRRKVDELVDRVLQTQRLMVDVCFSWMRSEGSRFTLGVWGWGCVHHMLCLCSQPSATVGNRLRDRRAALHSGACCRKGSRKCVKFTRDLKVILAFAEEVSVWVICGAAGVCVRGGDLWVIGVLLRVSPQCVKSGCPTSGFAGKCDK